MRSTIWIALALSMVPIVSHAAGQAQPGAAQGEQSAENKLIVEAAFARWAAGGTGFFQEVLAPDVVWTIEGSGPSAGIFRGRDALLAAIAPFTRRLAVPVRPVAYRVWVDGDHVVIHWTGEATTLDGRAYRNRYAWIFRMESGRAVEVNAFLDLAPYDAVIARVPLPRE
ncbi:ketosteroid isomerase [Sphingomonas spermidinifaciens]|uniref:Ketosteroid isomerase n=1 Tax=Sphingomonas spermidinifaciens TaxID=1141889 RepID=A0A2A4B276_9SPHN|nr:nuclear transport factor 2 family protein [Sphingomonas spermidinifaciens]PCD02180.1 ketosteroid isomerase [Sphingomonas spermidinifaciens]